MGAKRITNGHDTELDDLDLNDQQRLFVNHYIVHLDAQEAARRAGYAEASIRTRAYVVRWTPCVAEAIMRRLKKIERAADLRAERIIGELKTLGLSNLGDYFTPDENGSPRLVDWSTLTDEQLRALKKTKVKRTIRRSTKNPDETTETVTVELETHDKEGPLHLLARYLRLLDDGAGTGNTTNIAIFQNAVSAADAVFAAALARGQD